MEKIIKQYGDKIYKKSLIPPNDDIKQDRRMALELEGVDENKNQRT